MTPTLPSSLDWLGDADEGRAWLSSLPDLVPLIARDLDARVGEPFPDSYESLVLRVTLADGTAAVLKIPFPGRENAHEADALAHWDGNGAVRLLGRHAPSGALLLERCTPGTPLWHLGPEAALDLLVLLLPRLWTAVAAGSAFRSVAEEATWWANGLAATWERAGRPFERRLLDAALDALRTLPASQGEPVLLHQDLHGANVLRAEREPWLVIDPKPLVGEREFGLAPIVRSRELGGRRREMERRLDRLSAELGLDRDRARRWSLAQTVAWAFEGDRPLEGHVETARWLLAGMH